MTRLAGKVALVTEAAHGVGAAIARRFAAEGACVVVHSHDAQGAARVVADIVWRGGCAIAVAGDLAHWPDLRRLFEETAATFGRLDVLISNPRSRAPARPGDAARQSDADLFAAMLLCQEALRLFDTAGGSIINLSTLQRCELAPREHDAAPGAAMDALTCGLARVARARNIRVTAIAPGLPGPDEPAAIDVIDGAAASRQFVALPGLDRRGGPDAVARLAVSLVCDTALAGSEMTTH